MRKALAEAAVARRKAVHEAPHQKEARAISRARHLIGLARIHSQWLLAQHVLAGRERTKSPLAVQRVDEGDVDGIDLRVVENLLIRHPDPDERMKRSQLSSPLGIAAGDRHQATVSRGGNGGNNGATGDIRGAGKPPAHPVAPRHTYGPNTIPRRESNGPCPAATAGA